MEFFKGRGGTCYVGAGAAVLGYSPLVEAIAIYNKHKDYWIQGSCEPYEGAWAPGPVFFVTGGGGRCDDFGSTPPPQGPRGGRRGREEEKEGREGGVMVLVGEEEEEEGVGVGGLGSGLVGEERRKFFNSLFRNSVENEVKGGRRTRRLSPSFLSLPSPNPPSEGEAEDIGIWVRHSKTRQMNFTDQKMRQEMIEKNYVPPSFLLAAEAMLLAVKVGEGGREGRREGGMYLFSPPNGSCRVCGLDNVEGPGAKACVVEKECEGEEEGERGREGGERMLGQEEEEDGWFSSTFPSFPSSSSSISFVEYNEQFIILGDLHTTMSSSSTPPSLPPSSTSSSSLLQAAFRHALLLLLPSLDSRPQSLQLSVWSAEPDPFFAPSIPFSLPSSPSSLYKFIIVATDSDNATAIIDALSFSSSSSSSSFPSSSSSPSSSLNKAMLAFLEEGEREGGREGGVEQVELAVEKTMHIPAYDSEGFLQQQQAWKEGGKEGGEARRRATAWAEEEEGKGRRDDQGLFSVVLEDPSLPALRLTHLTFDHPYSLRLRGFSPSESVKLQLLLTSRRSSSGREGGREGEVRVLGEVLMDAWGHGEEGGQIVIFVQDAGEEEGGREGGREGLVIRVPAGEIPFALQAVDGLTGGVGFSALLVVSREGRKRRLYGPLVDF